jgi:hypothetical protein
MHDGEGVAEGLEVRRGQLCLWGTPTGVCWVLPGSVGQALTLVMAVLCSVGGRLCCASRGGLTCRSDHVGSPIELCTELATAYRLRVALSQPVEHRMLEL